MFYVHKRKFALRMIDATIYSSEKALLQDCLKYGWEKQLTTYKVYIICPVCKKKE